MSETTTAKAKPPVQDEDGNVLELGMRVKIKTKKDADANGGTQPEATVEGLEYQRGRVVLKVDGLEKLAVRPADKVRVIKKSGRIQRVERAVRAGRKAKAEAEAPASA